MNWHISCSLTVKTVKFICNLSDDAFFNLFIFIYKTMGGVGEVVGEGYFLRRFIYYIIL